MHSFGRNSMLKFNFVSRFLFFSCFSFFFCLFYSNGAGPALRQRDVLLLGVFLCRRVFEPRFGGRGGVGHCALVSIWGIDHQCPRQDRPGFGPVSRGTDGRHVPRHGRQRGGVEFNALRDVRGRWCGCCCWCMVVGGCFCTCVCCFRTFSRTPSCGLVSVDFFRMFGVLSIVWSALCC